MSWWPTEADGLDIVGANMRRQLDKSSKPFIALALVMILFVRLLLLSCWPFWNLARQGTNASPLRKGQQRVVMATRIMHYSMKKWGFAAASVRLAMGFWSGGIQVVRLVTVFLRFLQRNSSSTQREARNVSGEAHYGIFGRDVPAHCTYLWPPLIDHPVPARELSITTPVMYSTV